MTGRIVRSCIFYGLIAAGLGLALTLGGHMLTEDLRHARFLAPVWYRGEPQWFGVALTYGLIGAALRYLQIEVFGQTMPFYAMRPATGTNTGYKSAVLATAAMFMTPLLIYKLLIVDIQLDAADHAHPMAFIGFKDLLGVTAINDMSHTYFGDWAGTWPLDFYLITLIVGVIGGFVGFLYRADQRNEFLALVIPLGAAFMFLVLMAGAIFLTFLLCEMPGSRELRQPIPALFGAPSERTLFILTVVLPALGSIAAAIYRVTPAGRERRPAKLYRTPPTIAERFATFNRVTDAAGQLGAFGISVIVCIPFFGLGPWLVAFTNWGQNPEGDKIMVGVAAICNIALLILGVKYLGDVWNYFAPRRAPKLDPTSTLHGQRGGPTDGQVKSGLG